MNFGKCCENRVLFPFSWVCPSHMKNSAGHCLVQTYSQPQETVRNSRARCGMWVEQAGGSIMYKSCCGNHMFLLTARQHWHLSSSPEAHESSCPLKLTSWSVSSTFRLLLSNLSYLYTFCFYVILVLGCPSIPFLWTRYLRNALTEFPKIWCKYSLVVQGELIQFWRVKVTRHCVVLNSIYQESPKGISPHLAQTFTQGWPE